MRKNADCPTRPVESKWMADRNMERRNGWGNNRHPCVYDDVPKLGQAAKRKWRTNWFQVEMKVGWKLQYDGAKPTQYRYLDFKTLIWFYLKGELIMSTVEKIEFGSNCLSDIDSCRAYSMAIASVHGLIRKRRPCPFLKYKSEPEQTLSDDTRER